MEIIGCNNLISYEVENTMVLQHFLPCCNLLLNDCKHLVNNQVLNKIKIAVRISSQRGVNMMKI